jgi:NADH dehydrogenase
MDQAAPRLIPPSGWDGHRGRPRLVIVGGGFAGVAAAKGLRGADIDVLLIDRRNHQIFQPLLYQAATGVLAPADISAPLRQLAVSQPNVSVELGEVTAVDVAERRVSARTPDGQAFEIAFDFLLLATGVGPNYFGHDCFAASAPALKTLSDAEAIRSRILQAYELAEASDDAAERARLMTFVIVGAGPTGVELAATIAHMARVTLRRDFRRIRPRETWIVLLEGGKRLLPTFDERLAAAAQRQLDRLGVIVRTGAVAEQIDTHGVTVAGVRTPAATVIWAAGVVASPIAANAGLPADRSHRTLVGPDLEAEPGSNVFVAGDAASIMQAGDKPVPGVAQAALQQGRYVSKVIRARLAGAPAPPPFRYHDLGSMAVVGKDFALLEAPTLKMSGRLAWLIWAFIHIATLPRLQNRLRVGLQWFWTYFTGQRSSRLIIEPTWPTPPPQSKPAAAPSSARPVATARVRAGG